MLSLDEAKGVLRKWSEEATPDERLEMLEFLMDDICPVCGFKEYGQPCHCTNDE